MAFREPDSELIGDDHAQEREKDHAQTSVQQQSGRWAGRDARTTERMDAIRNIKTMAGSPDADRSLRAASRHLAHGLCVLGGPLFRETMKEDQNVQYSFRRDRLGWTSPQT